MPRPQDLLQQQNLQDWFSGASDFVAKIFVRTARLAEAALPNRLDQSAFASRTSRTFAANSVKLNGLTISCTPLSSRP
ncbi:hypothetical protein ACVWY3_000988 [Bradyrhizobium sp. USDA 4486]